MSRAGSLTLRILAATLLPLGTSMIAFGLGHLLAPRPAPTGTTPVYAADAACVGCPAGTSMDSVEVQARTGSTLFIVRGHWPQSVDALKASFRLNANDMELVLKPHGSKNAFELRATGAHAQLAPNSVAAGLQQDALLVDVGSAVLTSPVRFDLGLWNGQSYLARIPSSGELTWDGRGRPHLEAVASATPTAIPTATAPGTLDLTALVRACRTIPSGQVPTYLHLSQLASFPPADDPRTHVQARRVAALTTASLYDVKKPYTIVAVILHQADQAPAGQHDAVDLSGDVQLWLYSDGTTRHKGIRLFMQGRWVMSSAAEANALTYEVNDLGVAFYWTGLRVGDRFGFITADASGCSASGIDARHQPNQTIAS